MTADVERRIESFASSDAVMQAAAEHFVSCANAAIVELGRFAVALSGGSTPRALYELLATERCASRVDWTRVHVFWSDERCVAPDDPASNYAMARESLLDRVAVLAANVHRIRGEDDPEDAAASYERELRRELATPQGPPRRAHGARLDLVLLGMGNEGHTASLFPGTAALHETRRWVAAQEVAATPASRVTLTPPVINAAAAVTFLVCGRDKARTLRAVIEGPRQPDRFPAQIVSPDEGRLRWLIDADAAAALERR